MRIGRQIARRATTAVLSFGGWIATALGVAFVVSAFFTLPAQNTWSDRVEVGLLAAVVTLCAVGGAALLWCGSRYLWTRGSDEWLVKALIAGNAVSFYLERSASAPTSEFSDHGDLTCEVTMPAGRRVMPDVLTTAALTTARPPTAVRDARQVMVERTPPECGRYEVHWYGARKPGKPYEMMRSFVDINEADMGQQVGGTRHPSQP